MQSLHKNNTWKLVGCYWVYKRKEDPNNSDSIRYKVKLVAKGFTQKGVDYNEIFSPVGKRNCIRVLLSHVAHCDS